MLQSERGTLPRDINVLVKTSQIEGSEREMPKRI